jgi:CRISPR/Cas system-associated exonuclease Cas4 (RecB family)
MGAIRYSLLSNPHLARALRFRARRWESPRFGAADGMVRSAGEHLTLLDSQRLSARPYSATALAQFAVCPYKFYLHGIARLAEREATLAVDELDSRQRGVLFHAAAAAVLQQLLQRGLLPASSESAAAASSILHDTFEALAARARDDCAPAISGVFEATLEAVRSDLAEWLRRTLEERSWLPVHLELGFGVRSAPDTDAASRPKPVLLPAGVLLAGVIDLVERHVSAQGEPHTVLRATDYKTGAAPDKLGATSGGRMLQPLLYALALEQLFPDSQVGSGRLYFCTSRGSFLSHEVRLDARTRELCAELLRGIDETVQNGFLPAAPAPGACAQCAYRAVCGPYEEERVSQRKPLRDPRLAALHRIRSLW